MSHVTYAEEIHALETILARVWQEKAALEREARYHQQELDTLLGKLRAYEQSHKNLSADCDALARERDALAAHMEGLREVLWKIADTDNAIRCRELAGDAYDETPATSLARLVADHVEAAIGHAEALIEAGATAEKAFSAVRSRQAEGGE